MGRRVCFCWALAAMGTLLSGVGTKEALAQAGWQQGFVSVGGAVVIAPENGYEVVDGHSATGDNNVGIQADFAWEALDFLRLGLRVAYLNLGPASDTGIGILPAAYLGLKTPSLGFLPELYLDVGMGVMKGEIGDTDDYGVSPDSAVLGTAGVRYMIPKYVPISGGTYLFLEYNGYLYGRDIIQAAGFGLGWALW